MKTKNNRKLNTAARLEQKDFCESKEAKVIVALMPTIFEGIVASIYDQSDCNTILKKYQKNKGGKAKFIADSKDRIGAAVLQVLNHADDIDLGQICSYLERNGTAILSALKDPERRNSSFETLTPLNCLLTLLAGPPLATALMHGCMAKKETDELLLFAAYRMLDAFNYWNRFGSHYSSKLISAAR